MDQVDKFFDPTTYDATGTKALLLSQIPFARRENRPVLTVLGDHVESTPFGSWTKAAAADPLLRTLVEKQAWVPAPQRNMIVAGTKPGDLDHVRALTPDEYYDLVAMSGPEIRARLTESLAGATKVGERWYPPMTMMDPGEAKAFVSKVAAEEHRKALGAFK
jgi:hypothetical protein